MKNNSKFISILSDYGFKITFADESDTLFLRKALQALIQSSTPITKVRFLSNEFIGITETSRGGLYDLICEDEQGNSFIVEMQLGFYKNYIQRAKFYAFQRFNTLVEKGKYRFENLTKIYCIGFLAKGIFPDLEQYYHIGTLKNQNNEELDSQITHIIVEIDKFDKQEHELISDLDKLVYLMKNQEIIQQINELPRILSEDWIEKAINKLDKRRMTPEQRMHFEMMLAKSASIIEMDKEDRKRELEEARKVERQKISTQTAKMLLHEGMSVKKISEITGLSIEEIEKLK